MTAYYLVIILLYFNLYHLQFFPDMTSQKVFRISVKISIFSGGSKYT